MQVVCAKCSQVLEFAGARPSFCAYCGQAFSDPANSPTDSARTDESTLPPSAIAAEQTPPPEIMGGYRLHRELGSGGMGTVYESEEIASGRKAALKVISASFAQSADAVERFRQEGRIASMITHPRCVFVLGVDEAAGRPYIVMELMPGATLRDLVDQKGPLPPEEAIAKILDVIDGLQEAHRLQVIHRDVKPSNCFLEADGRVKVGDFGLAKSLVKDAHLTKTGAFIGTPHYASPEQVRGDNIDQQTDVYSVAATLYYLLTGKPPFWGSEAAATMARIVSDPAPPMGSLRPELSPALDRVVLRGLDRDRNRRWQDLDAFRQALTGLLPAPLAWTPLLLRPIAYLVDVLVLWLVAWTALSLLPPIAPGATLAKVVCWGIHLALFLFYFAILEHAWGCSLGKGVLRLQVCTAKWIDPPSWQAAALRTLTCFLLLHFGFLASALLAWGLARDSALVENVLPWGWSALGFLAMVSTMRAQGSFRGLHEVLSGTRVAWLPRPQKSQVLQGSGGWLLFLLGGRRLKQGVPHLSGLPEQIGGFSIRGAIKWTPEEKILLGEDASLGRRVLLVLRPQTEPPLERSRREVGRRSRLRWLGCGRQGELQWDALLAPSGCPLPEFIHSEGTLNWAETRPLLEELAQELSAACADSTLPRPLALALVWVQTDGRVQLADTSLATGVLGESEELAGTDQERSLALLRQTARLALEGKLPAKEAPRPLRASLPPRVRPVLDRLAGVGPPYNTVAQVQAVLAAARDS